MRDMWHVSSRMSSSICVMCINLNSVSQILNITRSGVDKVKFVENLEMHQNVIFLLNHKMNEKWPNYYKV